MPKVSTIKSLFHALFFVYLQLQQTVHLEVNAPAVTFGLRLIMEMCYSFVCKDGSFTDSVSQVLTAAHCMLRLDALFVLRAPVFTVRVFCFLYSFVCCCVRLLI